MFASTIVNVGFWRQVGALISPRSFAGIAILMTMGATLIAGHLAVLVALAHPRLFKPALVIFLLAAAPVGYVTYEYGIGVDHRLLATALQTDQAEAQDLVTGRLLVWCLALGVLPAWLVARHPLNWPPLQQRLLCNTKVIAVALAVAVTGILSSYGTLASLFREQRQLTAMITPFNGFVAVTTHTLRRRDRLVQPTSLVKLAPATRDPAVGAAAAKPSVTVFVVGETARADHFSINGYHRPTTPRLASAAGLINFPDATSCATLTADSLPCMFSGRGRAGSVKSFARTHEGLLDVLKGAGFDVHWIDNQSGCKGVCDRVRIYYTTAVNDPRFCASGECHDEILADELKRIVSVATRDTVVFLHMMGSHGPAYWKRHPDAFARFGPACRSAAFSQCTRDEIIAAYDNTIAYTDHVLGEILSVLQRADGQGHATSFLYVSDHGESLGEKGIYLHGVPFMIAPRPQTHVPMVIWLSSAFRERYALAPDCLKASQARPVSHDHLFHSMLGMLGLRSAAKVDALDLFRDCREARD